MSLPLAFRRAARAEFDEAADWYEDRRPGLGGTFVAAVQRVLDRAGNLPDYYPVVRVGVREGLVTGFPYAVYYREEPGRVVVFSVFHTSRDPAVWQSRV
jgi:toxin ParE1/3/4